MGPRRDGRVVVAPARPISVFVSPPSYLIQRAVQVEEEAPITVWFNQNVRETMSDPLYPLAWTSWRDAAIPVVTSHVSEEEETREDGRLKGTGVSSAVATGPVPALTEPDRSAMSGDDDLALRCADPGVNQPHWRNQAAPRPEPRPCAPAPFTRRLDKSGSQIAPTCVR